MINFFKRIAASEFAEEDGNAKPAVVAVVLLAAVILLVLAVIFKDQISALFAPDPNFEPNPNFPVGLESQ